MLKKNVLKVVISSIIILLPILFGVIMWNDLPDVMTTHWGFDGGADGFSGKAFAVFGTPIILLAMHFLCLFLTSLDKKQKEQNQKALGLIFWIIPMVSLLVQGVMYRAAFGKEFNIKLIVPTLIGVTFILFGNYLPKIKYNRTLGIKIYWTLNNEENWNITHRFSGKVWVIGGFVMLISAFLPLAAMLWVVSFAFVSMIVIPFVYSFFIYKQHQKEGIVYTSSQGSKGERIAVRITAIVLPIILIGIIVLMFTGNIEVTCNDASFTINATYWSDLEVDYSEVDAIEYRKNLDVGMKTNGFSSARLFLGIYQNDEFGSYTMYAYTSADEFIVLTKDDKVLVIGMSNAEDTKAIYDKMLEKIG